MNKITIHSFSLRSLKLELISNGNVLSSATGYLINKNNFFYLVSNYHVLSGRHYETNHILHSSKATPEKVRVYHHKKNILGHFIPIEYNLVDENNNPLFKNHSQEKNSDVAVLKIKPDLNLVDLYEIDYKNISNIDFVVEPSDDVSIVGFPFGLSSNACFPIWKTGHVASEISLPFQGLRCFLVDASTRGGMSGSPVYARKIGPFVKADGSTNLVGGGPVFKFLGMYSGRLNIPRFYKNIIGKESYENAQSLGSDIGMVWNWKLIDEII